MRRNGDATVGVLNTTRSRRAAVRDAGPDGPERKWARRFFIASRSRSAPVMPAERRRETEGQRERRITGERRV